VRAAFTSDLDQLRLQVELMALKADAALKRSNQVLMSGDDRLASEVLRGDDDIDAMLVSLTEKCYDILGRQNPVASDLRFIVSVLRTISDLERVGDLC
jgi:phosphate transport system protein